MLPVGEPVEPLPSGRAPERAAIPGRYARLEPLDPARHAASLFACSHSRPEDAALWTYMAYGPFPDQGAFESWAEDRARSTVPLFFVIVDGVSGAASGMASWLNIVPANSTIEIGHIWFSPLLQRTRAATEAIFLMIRHAFDDLRYRRIEWKCDSLNQASRRAALRFGFSYEGTFRQHMVVKGRNRDTAWFAMLDREWPALRPAFERWLSPTNFDAAGRQRISLRELMKPR